MVSEWPLVTVEDIAAKTPNALSTGPFGSAISSKFFVDEGVPVIRGSNLSADTGIRLNDDEKMVFVTEEKAKEFSRSIARTGDLIFTCWGTINQVGFLDGTSRWSEYIISNKQMKLTVDPELADPRYIYYLFSGPVKQQEILANGIGAAVPGFNLGQLKQHSFRLPPLPLQSLIADYIEGFDHKSKLNRQTNQTLENMAQALFKSWFVDFDPVIDNALAAGNIIPEPLQKRAEQRRALREAGDLDQQAPAPLPEAIRQLFPASFVLDAEMGWIPEGWEVKPLSEVTTELRRGISPKYVEEGGVPVVNQKCIRDHHLNFELCRRNNPELRKITGRELQIGDLLINSTGVGTLGRMAQVKYLEETTVVDSHVTVVRPNTDIYPMYAFAQMMLSIEPKIEALGEGSTGQTELSRKIVSETSVLIPPVELTSILDVHFQSYAEKTVCNTQQIQGLAKLRDTLLPKLISGELRIPEAQQQAKAAVA